MFRCRASRYKKYFTSGSTENNHILESILYNKINLYLKKTSTFTVYITPALKCMEVRFEGEVKSADESVLKEKFEEWFYEEGSESVGYSVADTFLFDFSLQDEKLFCVACWTESSRDVEDDVSSFDKEYLFTPFVRKIIAEHIDSAEDLDVDRFEAEFQYEGAFNYLNLFYDDEEIKLKEAERLLLQSDIYNVFVSWDLPDLDNVKISLEQHDVINIQTTRLNKFIINESA